MNEMKEIAAKKSNLQSTGIKLLSYEEIMKDIEFLHSGESRGIPFTLQEGEVFYFEPLEKAAFFWTTFLGKDKKEYKVYKTIACSSIRGAIEFPLAKLCYSPSLEAERNFLFGNDNLLGRILAEAPSDHARICIVAGKKVEAFKAESLHQDYWRTNPETKAREKITDAEDLPYRKPLLCFRLRFIE